ncbi:hypothetical protein IHE45_03G095700 [Dioscorea alata]|uniref:Uncharacterized protein n=1 Tax=Dioscorea alata TaxID=55571 RepID=A0ACB7WME8_DIOAL|nr:hypothetical protein IHE45_03G095700 [Dioscorea alata]
MSSMFENLQKKRFFPTMPEKDELPISQDKHKETHIIGLRRRLSSFSINVQPLTSASTAWAFRRSQSMPSFGEFAGGPLRKWWDWSWGWILSRKPAFAKDIEMNEEESTMLGYNSKGSLKHLLYKLRSEFRRLLRSETLPTTQGFRYDSFSYAQNFDDGRRIGDE